MKSFVIEEIVYEWIPMVAEGYDSEYKDRANTSLVTVMHLRNVFRCK